MPAATDAEWLHLRLAKSGRRLDADALHDFIERVGIKTDSEMDEQTARDQAFEELFA